jgi:outer membrane receptor protein involved in Fe transport
MPGKERRRSVKILVALKRVADPDNANKIKIAGAGNTVDTTGLEWKVNPFDEDALEAALRLTENGKAPKQRIGEVVTVTLGPKEGEQMLRASLATGADRAIRIDTPRYTGLVGAEVSRAVRRGAAVFGRVEAVHYGPLEYDPSNLARQDAYTITNLRLGLRGDRLLADVWVRNAFDTRYVPLAFPYQFSSSGFIGEPGRPRTFGISLGVGF